MHPDHGLHLDDAGGDLDEAEAQRVELGDAPHRTLWHRHAKSPHQPVRARMQEQPKLVGCRPGAGRAIRRQMGLPGLDMVFGLAAPAIDILVEPASVAFAQIGDDEAGVRSFRARFDASDDPLDPAPALRAVEELHETTKLAISRRGLESRLRAGFETFDMAAQCRGWRDAEDVIEAIGATPIENLGTAIVAVGPQQDLGVGQ